MSDLIILTQPRAFRPLEGEFLHSANFAWLVRGLVDSAFYSDLLESDTVLESLELFGDDTWEVLETSGLLKPSALATVRDQVTCPDGSVCFYPVVRLRTPDAPALVHPTSYSPHELDYTTNQLLGALAANRFKLTRAAREHLGDGDEPDLVVSGRVSALELLQLELSDTSVLLGWGWVWY